MRSQECKNAARLEKMTRYRLRIQQFTLTIRSTLHTKIMANNQRKQADRRAALFRAFLGHACRGELGKPGHDGLQSGVVGDALEVVARRVMGLQRADFVAAQVDG